jgi:hypothetical protein
MRLLFALTPILCTVALPAADDLDAILSGNEQLSWVEVRLGVGRSTIPDTYPVHVKIYGGGDLEFVDSVDNDTATTFSYTMIGADLRPYGLVGGVELIGSEANQKLTHRTINGVDQPMAQDPSRLRFATLGGNGLLGCGLSLGSHAHVEALGVLGGGGLNLDFANGTGEWESQGSGWYWNYGLRGGIYYRIHRFVIGALVEYMHTEYHADRGWDTVETSTDTDVSGIGYRLEIGYHIQ